MFTVSQSKLKCWRTCRMQYYFKFILNLMRKRKARPLMRGTIIHDMIEDKIEKRDPWKTYGAWLKSKKKIFAEEAEDYGDLPKEIKYLMEGYFLFYKKDPVTYIRRQGRKSEYPFEVPLCEGINLKGRIDTTGRTRDKLIWLVEHKSHAQIPTSEFKFTDIQSGLYTWVMPQIGLPEPDGVMWDYIRAKCPSTPELLKSGLALSKRANIDTTWPVYLETIKSHGFDPKDYADVKENLQGKEHDFYSRPTLPISKKFQANLLEDSIMTAKEIRRRAGKDKTRNIGKHCSWCDFQPACQAMLMGLDAKYILKADYMESDYHG